MKIFDNVKRPKKTIIVKLAVSKVLNLKYLGVNATSGRNLEKVAQKCRKMIKRQAKMVRPRGDQEKIRGKDNKQNFRFWGIFCSSQLYKNSCYTSHWVFTFVLSLFLQSPYFFFQNGKNLN